MTETNLDSMAETTDKPAPVLNLQDLANVLSVINTAVKRGAFEANEVKMIGELYEKIETFLLYQTRLSKDKANMKENN